MRITIPASPKAGRAAVALALVVLAAACASAQQESPAAKPAAKPTPKPTPTASPTPSPESRFLKNVLHDQAAIWTSPLRVGVGDAKWLVPLGAGAAVLFATDRRTAGEELEGGNNPTRLKISRGISHAGDFYAAGGFAAAFYLAGRSSHDARARETGLLGAEALVDGLIVGEALKAVARRARPPVEQASGEFFSGGKSFPSGHAISAWSLATVVANEYRHKPLVKWGAYSLAAAVSVSRFTGRKHFLSDVLIGSAIGYGIGRYVYVKRHDPSLDGEESADASPPRSKLFPSITPRYGGTRRGGREYGVLLAWNF